VIIIKIFAQTKMDPDIGYATRHKPPQYHLIVMVCAGKSSDLTKNLAGFYISQMGIIC
jgi:hypothetical protein